MNNFFLTTLLLVFPAMLQAASVYKWVDENGDIHYSDMPKNQSAEKIDIAPEPDAEKVEQARQREKILHQAADDLQVNRKQRETNQQKLEKEQRKQQRLEEQAQAEEKVKKEKEKKQREGRSKGHYQQQWQQQLPPHSDHPAVLPIRR